MQINHISPTKRGGLQCQGTGNSAPLHLDLRLLSAPIQAFRSGSGGPREVFHRPPPGGVARWGPKAKRYTWDTFLNLPLCCETYRELYYICIRIQSDTLLRGRMLGVPPSRQGPPDCKGGRGFALDTASPQGFQIWPKPDTLWPSAEVQLQPQKASVLP